MSIGVVGAGSWGTTLANHIAGKGSEVDLWGWEQDVCCQIRERRINETFLSGIKLSELIRPVQSFEEVCKGKDLLLIVVPSHVFRDILMKLYPFLSPVTPLVVATKGIENETLMTMSQVIQSVLPGEWSEHCASLSGPSFAREVCYKHPTAVTLGSRNKKLAIYLQELFSTECFRVYNTRRDRRRAWGGAEKRHRYCCRSLGWSRVWRQCKGRVNHKRAG